MLFDKVINLKIKSITPTIHFTSVLKAISWRIVGTLDTWFISFVITGKASLALSIASFEVFTKMLLYYLHERGWEKIKDKLNQNDNHEHLSKN